MTLTQLAVHDLALVEHLELELRPGLNVLTGETGAGKSVLVGALSLVLGARSRPDLVRAGADEGRVEALFELGDAPELRARLDAAGIASPDDQLLVTRSVRRRGRGKVSLNGRLGTVAMLGELLRGTVDLTSQHEHVALLEPEAHLALLDAYAGAGEIAAEVAEAHRGLAADRRALAELAAAERSRLRRHDFLRFALDEIETADPRLGEVEALTEERRRLRHVDELAEGLSGAEAALYSGDGAVVEVLGRLGRRLDRLVELDPELEPLRQSTERLAAEVEDLSRGLGRRMRSLEADPGRLAAIEERLETLEDLFRKHGSDAEALLAEAEHMRAELGELDGAGERRAALDEQVEVGAARLDALGARLSSARRRAAAPLEAALTGELAQLALPDARVELQIQSRDEVGGTGGESVELLIATNPGEAPRSIRKTASGGELSRVLLAVKQVLSSHSAVRTHVFDEVDTGVGGATAEILGAKLARVAEGAQVLVVTHLPQVAAFADAHFRVVKQAPEGRAVTSVEALDELRAVEEIARMLGGVEITARTRALAAELRERAGRGGAEIRRLPVGKRARRRRAG